MTHVVTLQPSGRHFACQPGQTILDAGLANGMGLPFSCRSGVCRTCRGKVVQGRLDPGEVHPAYLSEADKAQGFVHLCQARPLSDCAIEIDEWDTSRAYPVRQFPARIVAMRLAAPDVMIVGLSLPPNEPLRFHAGQYMDVADKRGVTRSYSIATAPSGEGLRKLELHIRHMPGGAFTDALFSATRPKDILQLTAPLGQFMLDDASSAPIVMLAAGTGFAPIKAMIEDCLARGVRRPLHLYWGARRKQDLYLHELARQWADEHEHIRYTPVLSDATPECEWTQRTGFVHHAVMHDYPDLSAHQVYACGAPAMVESARRDFIAQCGLPEASFHADAFVSEADKARQDTSPNGDNNAHR